VPEGKEEVVIARVGGATNNDRLTDLDWIGEPLSLTDAVKLNVPLAVGVPEIKPVDAVRLRPAGREPEVIDQE
jgi:hypothetical protein